MSEQVAEPAIDGTNDQGRRPWIRAWLVVGLAAWLAIGVDLVDRANRQGLVTDIGFSPYHLVAYAGLLVLAVYAFITFVRGLRHGDWRRRFPSGYLGLGLGFACFVGWIVLDWVWRNSIGISGGIENAFAPTRLLIPTGIVLVASGPLQEALAARPRADRRLIAAGVASVSVIGSAVLLIGFNPIRDPWNDRAINPGRDASEIWAMAPDGRAQTRLLPVEKAGIDYSLPAWSPDGSRIAFTRWSNVAGLGQNIDPGDQTSSVWTMAADGTDLRQLVDGTPGQAWIPAWSPDGQWIAYTLSPAPTTGTFAGVPEPNAPPAAPLGPPSGAGGAEIWLVHPDGSGAHRVSDAHVDAEAPAWSPDGRSIAYGSFLNGTSDIYIADVAGAELRGQRALAADPANDWGPSWSVDGKTVAFSSDRSGNEEIWTAPVDGSAGLKQLTNDNAGDWVPAWSPDGTRIAFVSDRGGDVEVWSMATDGSDLRDLSNSPSTGDGQWSVAWSPDGSRLLYASAPYPLVTDSWLARQDFATTIALLFGAVLAVMALLIVALGAPRGAFTAALTIVALLSALPSDGWRFVPGAFLAGAAVDLVVWAAPHQRMARVAAAALAAAGVLGVGLTLAFQGTLAWSMTLLLGVTVSVGLLGWGLAAVVARLSAAASSEEAGAPSPE
jgi:Tol biopolymer transport system component